MNRTEAIKAHKLSASMVTAIESMSYSAHDAKREGHTGYRTHADIHPRTRKALHDRGIMHGHYYLTAEGVNILAALAGNRVDAAMMSAPEAVTVTDMPSEPDFLAPGAAECYFGCGSDVVAVFVDYVGRTEGLCVAHRDRVEGETYELPTAEIVKPQTLAWARQSMGKDVVTGEPVDNNTTQESDSMTDNTIPAVLIPGVHALDMGTKGYNRFAGIGESQGVPGSLYTYGLATAISKAPGMNGTGKVNIPCEYGDVITVRTSLGDVRYVVEDNRYSATGPRKGDPILTRYETDDVRCYVCETHGDNSMPGKNIDGEWVCGFCVANYRTPANLNSHSLTFYVETEKAGTKYNCEGPCGGINNRASFAEFLCEGDDDENEDAGFVEHCGAITDHGYICSVDSVEKCNACTPSTGAGFHTVADSVNATPEAPVSTGTTHHTMDENGAQWERFEHVLTVGDVVKAVGMQGVYEVHCLIPGLPVVYVLGTTGEPFPLPASKVYAL